MFVRIWWVKFIQAPKNRVILLKLEEEFYSYVADPTRVKPYKLPPWDSYHRMLAHRCVPPSLWVSSLIYRALVIYASNIDIVNSKHFVLKVFCVVYYFRGGYPLPCTLTLWICMCLIFVARTWLQKYFNDENILTTRFSQFSVCDKPSCRFLWTLVRLWFYV